MITLQTSSASAVSRQDDVVIVNPLGEAGAGCSLKKNLIKSKVSSATTTSLLHSRGEKPGQSVGRLLDDVGGDGVVAGDADGVAGQGAPVPLGSVAAGQEDKAERGEEDLPVGGGDQVVQHRVYG